MAFKSFLYKKMAFEYLLKGVQTLFFFFVRVKELNAFVFLSPQPNFTLSFF